MDSDGGLDFDGGLQFIEGGLEEMRIGRWKKGTR